MTLWHARTREVDAGAEAPVVEEDALEPLFVEQIHLRLVGMGWMGGEGGFGCGYDAGGV